MIEALKASFYTQPLDAEHYSKPRCYFVIDASRHPLPRPRSLRDAVGQGALRLLRCASALRMTGRVPAAQMPLWAVFDGLWLYREEQNRHPEIAHRSTKGLFGLASGEPGSWLRSNSATLETQNSRPRRIGPARISYSRANYHALPRTDTCVSPPTARRATALPPSRAPYLRWEQEQEPSKACSLYPSSATTLNLLRNLCKPKPTVAHFSGRSVLSPGGIGPHRLKAELGGARYDVTRIASA
jgi:hypothetical protein